MPPELSTTAKDEGNHLTPTLTRSPESDSETTAAAARQIPQDRPAIRRDLLPLYTLRNRNGENYKDLNDLHPYVQTLTVADVESCVALENASFPPEERCSPEKVRALK
jgi:hypothetical protein